MFLQQKGKTDMAAFVLCCCTNDSYSELCQKSGYFSPSRINQHHIKLWSNLLLSGVRNSIFYFSRQRLTFLLQLEQQILLLKCTKCISLINVTTIKYFWRKCEDSLCILAAIKEDKHEREKDLGWIWKSCYGIQKRESCVDVRERDREERERLQRDKKTNTTLEKWLRKHNRKRRQWEQETEANIPPDAVWACSDPSKEDTVPRGVVFDCLHVDVCMSSRQECDGQPLVFHWFLCPGGWL